MNNLITKIRSIVRRPKKLAIILTITAVSIMVAYLMINSNQVTAQILPVTVNVNHLSFGNVFPGEKLQGEFIVAYVEEQGSGLTYRIIQKPKPCPQENPNCGPGGYYKNLCPYLEKVSNENEGDSETQATIGPVQTDRSDTWTIYFKVPAIFGNVGQDHTGGVVNESGDYGCDIAIDIDWEPPAPVTSGYSPIADSRVYEINPNNNYGDQTDLSIKSQSRRLMA